MDLKQPLLGSKKMNDTSGTFHGTINYYTDIGSRILAYSGITLYTFTLLLGQEPELGVTLMGMAAILLITRIINSKIATEGWFTLVD